MDVQEYRDELLQSGQDLIVENVRDDVWGVGKQGQGRNMMGKIHMANRRELRKRVNEIPDQIPSGVRVLVISDSILDNGDIMEGLRSGLPSHWQVAALHWNGGTAPMVRMNLDQWMIGIPTENIQVAIIHVGINDVNTYTQPSEYESLRENILEIGEMTHRICRNAAIVISGLIPKTKEANQQVWDNIAHLNGELECRTRDRMGYFVYPSQFWVAIRDGEGSVIRWIPDSFMLRDGVHLSQAGITAWVQNMLATLEKIGRNNRQWV